jgi:tetratricopeptide (TPR) repeat protein/TolB-like protein
LFAARPIVSTTHWRYLFLMRLKPVSIALTLVVFRAGTALAQCPDGTPPPCRGAASAGARRPNPPLDAQTWIIVPFDNVARVPDIDWLKDASVNLLYLDMSKWRDIRVIDDERVADFIREVPEARGGQTLTLQSGIAVARRAGAGKLVMGDLLKVGARTQLVAKVFDVRTGQRLRTVRQEAPVADSIMPAFGLLARGVLNVEPPSGLSLGAIGTTRLDAYQEYMEGVRALNAFEIPEAHRHLDRAIALDSTFALAHYKLTIVIGWENSSDPAHLVHAQAAARLSGQLPARERTLISGQLAQANGDYGRACELYSPLLRADSNDVEALYNFGECSYHDAVVVPVPGDSSRLAFRGSWNASMRAFRRVLALDPTYHLAFQHVQDVLLAVNRPGCLPSAGTHTCPEGTNRIAAVRREGDSVVTVPVAVTSNAGGYDAQLAAARRDRSHRRNLDEARLAALEWLEAGPAEARARIVYGRILLRMGRVDSADVMLRQVTGRRARTEQAQFVLDRIEVAVKLGHESEGLRLLDSLRGELDSVAGARFQIALGAAMFGQFGDLDSAIAKDIQAPPFIKRYLAAEVRALAGAPVDSLFTIEQVYAASILQFVGASRVSGLLLPTLAWVDFRDRGARWPAALDTASTDPRLQLVAVVAAGDTARVRRTVARFDSTAESQQDEPEDGASLLSANAHLLVSDSAAALARLRRFRDATWYRTPILSSMATGLAFSGMIWARSFLLLGDLAAAQGQRAEAADAYRRFIGMWQHADPEAQPLVQRARDALARLGS